MHLVFFPVSSASWRKLRWRPSSGFDPVAKTRENVRDHEKEEGRHLNLFETLKTPGRKPNASSTRGRCYRWTSPAEQFICKYSFFHSSISLVILKCVELQSSGQGIFSPWRPVYGNRHRMTGINNLIVYTSHPMNKHHRLPFFREWCLWLHSRDDLRWQVLDCHSRKMTCFKVITPVLIHRTHPLFLPPKKG